MDAVSFAYGLKEPGRPRSRRGFLRSGMATAAAMAALPLWRYFPQKARADHRGAQPTESEAGNMESNARLAEVLRRYGSELGEVDNVRIRG